VAVQDRLSTRCRSFGIATSGLCVLLTILVFLAAVLFRSLK
jgi:hypothetical protein